MITAYLASISKHITVFFRFLGSKRSLRGSTSYLSLFRTPFFLLYRNFIMSVMCWYYLFICVIFCAHLCFVCCLWFLSVWVRSCWFPFCSIFPWNVSFLFSSFYLMSVSKPTIYNRITSFFSGYSSAGEVYEEILFWQVSFEFCHLSSLVMFVMFGYYFFYFMYTLYNLFRIFWFLCLVVGFMCGFLFVIYLIVCEKY